MDNGPLHLQPTLAPPYPSAASTWVPAEIWTKIIHWGMGGPGVFIDEAARQDFLHIRQVSTVWRAIAFSTPDFWRHLSIDTRGEFYKGHHTDEEPAIVASRLRVSQWFKRAGQGAEVHLRIGGWRIYFEHGCNHWGDVALGVKDTDRPYNLVTCQIWEEETSGLKPDIRIFRKSMLVHLVEMVSPKLDDSLGSKVSSLRTHNGTTPSVAIWSAYRLFFDCLDRHSEPSTCRSLLLSHMVLEQRDFLLFLLIHNQLEELVLHNSRFISRDNTDPIPVVNTTIQTLVCNPTILLRWPPFILPSIRVLKLTRNTAKTFQNLPGHEEDDPLIPNNGPEGVTVAGRVVVGWGAKDLIIDMTLLNLESHDIIPFLSSFGSLRSLRLKDLSPLLSDDERVRAWRRNPNVKEVICQQSPAFPPTFTLLPSPGEHHSSPATLSVYVPSRRGEQEASCVRCVENVGGGDSTCFDLIRLPQRRINELLEDGVVIQNHEFEMVKESFRD
jgi:hypothetical protein